VLVAPGTPNPIFDRMNRELNDALVSPKTRRRIADMLLEPAGGRPEKFGAFICSTSEHWGNVIKQAGSRWRRRFPTCKPKGVRWNS
jgi:tripartite-type tricarboxylate transporter receptor subunit TctC